MVEDQLLNIDKINKPIIIKFRPWLIGNRDALITSLFGELAAEIDQIASSQGEFAEITINRAKEAGETLRKFANRLSKIGSIVEFIGKASGLGAIEMMGAGAKTLSEPTNEEKAAPQLSELKDKLVNSLRELDCRFVVTIDDVDRLEPHEALELLRLIRSVMDLPNVIYLLCYDTEILAHSIEKATRVQSGRAYLEKIIQLTVMVPKPESLQLRQWFSDELRQIGTTKNDDELSRLKLVINHEGGRQLRTPRSVARALDAVRFFWPPLRDAGADFADLVWLQLIKDGNPALYRWIEEYFITIAAISIGTVRIENSEKDQVLGQLIAAVPDKYFEDTMYRYLFSEIVPGVKSNYTKTEPKIKIFERIDEEENDKAIRNKRLASPDLYRYYFALGAPSHALANDDFLSIWAAAETSSDQLGAALLRFHRERVTESLSKADILLERIRGGSYADLSENQRINMINGMADTMDEAYRASPFDLHWINSLWDRAERLISLLLIRLSPQLRESVISRLFTRGKAIGWLTSLFRNETFSHGRFGDRQLPECEWIFTDAELDQVTERITHRYKAMSAREIFRCPSPINLLFAWRQGGDELGPRQLIESHTISNEGLIETLEILVSKINSSSTGEVEVLRKENLDPFMNYEAVTQRISALLKDEKFGKRAKILSEALNRQSRY